MARSLLKSAVFLRSRAVAALAAFVLALLGGLWLHRDAVLHDTDAYYHLAIGRAYAAGLGAADGLPWARLSLMHEGFGDKEWLFHVLLEPFATFEDPVAGGRTALVLAAAVLAAVLAWLAGAELGAWAALLPLWLFFASTETAWRLVRLRPELLSLLLLLLAVEAMGRGRDRLLGALALVYSLSYTAFHVLPGLAGLVFLVEGVFRRRWRWRMPAYAVLGGLAGLLVHPHFPKNLEVWLIQNVQFFASKGVLDVGTEIRPNTTDVLLMVNIGFFLGLAILWRSGRPIEAGAEEGAEDLSGPAIARGVAATVFGLLYLLMSRFSIYVFPFAALFCLAEMRRRGLRPGGRVRLGGGRGVRFAAAVLLVLLVSLPEAWRQLGNYRHRTDPGPDGARIRDREALSAALAPGARVAADWGPTATYMLWAPQALYLNVLDPVFMATPYPQAHRTLRAVLDGEAPDVPRAVAELLSDHLAFPTTRSEALIERLNGDSRVRVLHQGSHVLVRFVPARFVLDWKSTDGTPWPRSTDPWARTVEGYVDGNRLSEERCVDLVHDWTQDTPEDAVLAFAPYGPSMLRLDGRLLADVRDTPRAFVGRGVRLPVALSAGPHRLELRTCAAGEAGEKGFYLSRRAG